MSEQENTVGRLYRNAEALLTARTMPNGKGDLFFNDLSRALTGRNLRPEDLRAEVDDIFQWQEGRDAKVLKPRLRGLDTNIPELLARAVKSQRTRTPIGVLKAAVETGHVYPELIDQGHYELPSDALPRLDLREPRPVSFTEFDLLNGSGPWAMKGFLYLRPDTDRPYFVVTGTKDFSGGSHIPLGSPDRIDNLSRMLWKFE